MNFKNLIRDYAPNVVHNWAITVFNTLQYRQRTGGKYCHFRKYYKDFDAASKGILVAEQERRFKNFIERVRADSPYYKKLLKLNPLNTMDDLANFPVLEKKDLINQFQKIITIKEHEGIVSYTGGTTGASLKVLYTKENSQERFAALDNFRAKFGYELGEKVAWFSGKEILSEKDRKAGRFHKDDFINKIRFFSTFHISKDSFEDYWRGFCQFRPKFVVGFPSSVYQLAKLAESVGKTYPYEVSVFFPTAETVTQEHRDLIGRVFGCRVADQYASSEGAPFIFECNDGNMHINPLTGVFEVVDRDLNYCREGELIVTAFATEGTPLIRYRIGDRIRLSDHSCPCGSQHPMIDGILGREDDYLFSPWTGKINLGNISNVTKGVNGLVCFQIIQNYVDHLLVKLVAEPSFSQADVQTMKEALWERFGAKMKIETERVSEIKLEKSGKFRLIRMQIDPPPD